MPVKLLYTGKDETITLINKNKITFFITKVGEKLHEARFGTAKIYQRERERERKRETISLENLSSFLCLHETGTRPTYNI